ncbi:hypothetical protein [Snuella sedimenti]|nr:hypothetical protein [Snuella sedimenti]
MAQTKGRHNKEDEREDGPRPTDKTLKNQGSRAGHMDENLV